MRKRSDDNLSTQRLHRTITVHAFIFPRRGTQVARIHSLIQRLEQGALRRRGQNGERTPGGRVEMSRRRASMQRCLGRSESVGAAPGVSTSLSNTLTAHDVAREWVSGRAREEDINGMRRG
jgi:hypothetical protein